MLADVQSVVLIPQVQTLKDCLLRLFFHARLKYGVSKNILNSQFIY